MKTSEAGIHLMHKYEGYRDKPYQCPAKLWTIGWGHVMYPTQVRLPILRKEGYTGILRAEMPLRPEDDRIWSKDELVEIFKTDLGTFERGVLRFAPNLDSPEHQHKFDACVAFSFNLGLGGFQRSGIRQAILREDWDAAAEGFMKYVKAGGQVLKGLVRRRGDERSLFLS